MGYSKARLQRAIVVFRQARQEEQDAAAANPASPTVTRQIRGRRRGVDVTAANALANDCDADGEVSDDYNPDAPRKRRIAGHKTPKAKRQRTDTDGGAATEHANGATIDNMIASTRTGVLLNDNAGPSSIIYNAPHTRLGDGGSSATLVTLRLTSDGARSYLRSIAPPRTALSYLPSGTRRAILTYLDKQDEESEQIDEGVTRSGLRRKTQTAETVHGSSALSSSTSAASPPSPDKPINQLRSIFRDYHGISTTAGRTHQDPIVLISPSPPPTSGLRLPQPQMSTFIKITPWAHPIDFKCPFNDPSRPCHFCADFRYGIYGYGEIDAELYQIRGETQLHEAGSGHASQGKEATRMCIRCALRRLYISRCLVHKMCKFQQADRASYIAYTKQLTEESYPKTPIPVGLLHTCALCSQPAFWKCVADKDRDQCNMILEGTKGRGKGCGLLLCESCATNVQAEGGILKRSTVRKASGTACRRADMEFLFSDSLLHKAWK